MIILIFIPSEDTKHTTTDHLQQSVIGSTSPVIELPGQVLGKATFVVPLPKDQ